MSSGRPPRRHRPRRGAGPPTRTRRRVPTPASSRRGASSTAVAADMTAAAPGSRAAAVPNHLGYGQYSRANRNQRRTSSCTWRAPSTARRARHRPPRSAPRTPPDGRRAATGTRRPIARPARGSTRAAPAARRGSRRRRGTRHRGSRRAAAAGARATSRACSSRASRHGRGGDRATAEGVDLDPVRRLDLVPSVPDRPPAELLGQRRVDGDARGSTSPAATKTRRRGPQP